MSYHSSDSFSVSGKTLIGEISELARPVMRRIFPDACDLGFTVRSTRTNKQVEFYINEEHLNDDGITHWVLLPVDRILREQGVKVVLFND